MKMKSLIFLRNLIKEKTDKKFTLYNLQLKPMTFFSLKNLTLILVYTKIMDYQFHVLVSMCRWGIQIHLPGSLQINYIFM